MAIKGILGKKIGMTQFFKENGECLAVTALEVGPCAVVQIKKPDSDGYTALQLGFDPRKEKSCTKPELGHFKKSGLKPFRFVGEVQWDGQGEVKVGDQLGAELFENVSFVDVIGRTRGRGFMGVVRRWGFHGGPATHGQSDRERHGGSLGRQGSVNGDVIKNKKMGGHYGDEQVTSKNIGVVKILKEKNILLVHGPVPGYDGAYVRVNISLKVRKAQPVKKGKQVQIIKKK